MNLKQIHIDLLGFSDLNFWQSAIWCRARLLKRPLTLYNIYILIYECNLTSFRMHSMWPSKPASRRQRGYISRPEKCVPCIAINSHEEHISYLCSPAACCDLSGKVFFHFDFAALLGIFNINTCIENILLSSAPLCKAMSSLESGARPPNLLLAPKKTLR